MLAHRMVFAFYFMVLKFLETLLIGIKATAVPLPRASDATSCISRNSSALFSPFSLSTYIIESLQ